MSKKNSNKSAASVPALPPAEAGRNASYSTATSPPNTAEDALRFGLYKKIRSGSTGAIGSLVLAEVRKAICETHVPLVHRISRQFRFRRFDATVSEFELQSAGMIGLMKAVDMFDEDVGHSFVAYAAQRIRGEMLDWLREVDPYSRDVRRLERAASRMVRLDGRRPNDDDLAEAMDITPDRVRKLRSNRRAMARQSLDDIVAASDDSAGVRRSDLINDSNAVDPLDTASERELLEVCRNRLSGREAKVFFENAFDDRSLREIGDELGISESRACQIRRDARLKLASFLVGRGEVPGEWLEDL